MRTLLITTTILSLAASMAFAEPTTTPSASVSRASPATSSKFLPKEEWDKLSPEQKKHIKEERFQNRKAERAEWKKKYDAASPEEKEQMKKDLDAKHEANKAKWKERYDAASPEEKKKMEARAEHRKERRKEWRKEHDKTVAPEKAADTAK